jgi:hypothetical protein
MAKATHDLDATFIEPPPRPGLDPVYRTLCGVRVFLTGLPHALSVATERLTGILERSAPGEVPTCRRCFARMPVPSAALGARPAPRARP